MIMFSLFSPREDIYLLGLELKVPHLGWLRENLANYLHSVIFTQKQVHIMIIFYPSCEPLGGRGFSTKDCVLPACDNLSGVE